MQRKARSGRFKSLGEAAHSFLKRRLGERLSEYEAVKIWPQAVGPRISARCVAFGIKSGILHIKVPNNVWLTELSTLKEKLISTVNKKLGQEVVKGIIFKVGALKRNR